MLTDDEAVAYLNQISDSEIKQMVKEKTIEDCIGRFQHQMPNARSACNCVMDKVFAQLSAEELRIWLLPKGSVQLSIANESLENSQAAMMQAAHDCGY
ncbi:hypothetical protein B0181_05970 [Moraxella caviae]|nr:hypothetical protein [Moraxella caviae]OOR89954.1 hypothetical protein B0181_05970 [Moraxella caviae]